MSRGSPSAAASRPHSTLGRLATVSAFLVIAAATLRPTPDTSPATESVTWCFFCGELGGVDFVLNVLLFVPLGAALSFAGLTPLRATGVALATTVMIEALQLHIVAGRDSSLGDLVANTVGGALGASLAYRWRGWLLPDPRAAMRLLVAGTCVWLFMLICTAFLLQRSLPHTLYFGQWAPNLAHLDTFHGSVLSSEVNGAAFQPGPIERAPMLRRALGADTAHVEATILPGRWTSGLAPIVSIFDQNRTEVLLLGQWGEHLAFRIRLRVSDARLRPPIVFLPYGLPERGKEGDTLRIGGGFRGKRLFALARSREEVKEATLALTPAIGWQFLWPFRVRLQVVSTALTLAWVGAWLLPLGYWLRRASPPRPPTRPGPREADWRPERSPMREALFFVCTLGLGFAVVPIVLGTAPIDVPIWIGAVVALVLGRWLGSLSLRNRGPNAAAATPQERGAPGTAIGR